MGQLTRDLETRLLRIALISPTDVTAQPSMPIMVRLMTAEGGNTSAGVEATGDMYEAQESSWGISTITPGATAINMEDISFSGISTTSDVTIVGVELWDSSSIPLRLAWAPLSSPTIVRANASFEIGRGQIKVTIL